MGEEVTGYFFGPDGVQQRSLEPAISEKTTLPLADFSKEEQLQRISERKAYIAEQARVLLENQEVKDAYNSGDEAFEQISLARNEDKGKAFVESAFGKTRREMEAEGSEFSPQERERINVLNRKLAENPTALEFLLGTPPERDGVVFEAISQNLESRKGEFLTEERITNELSHYRDVFTIVKKLCPNDILAQLAAIAHDSGKYDTEGRMQLGLHEVDSTETGAALATAALKTFQKQLGFTDQDIALAHKTIRRIIYTHGNGEYPELVSAKTPFRDPEAGEDADTGDAERDAAEKSLYWLWGNQLYLRTEVRSTPDDPNEPMDELQEAITALNVADKMVGCDVGSFTKYNLSLSNQRLMMGSFEEYIQTGIFASFESNLSNEAVDYFMSKGTPMQREALQGIAGAYRMKAALFLDGLGMQSFGSVPEYSDEMAGEQGVPDGVRDRLKKNGNELRENFAKMQENSAHVARMEKRLAALPEDYNPLAKEKLTNWKKHFESQIAWFRTKFDSAFGLHVSVISFNTRKK